MNTSAVCYFSSLSAPTNEFPSARPISNRHVKRHTHSCDSLPSNNAISSSSLLRCATTDISNSTSFIYQRTLPRHLSRSRTHTNLLRLLSIVGSGKPNDSAASTRYVSGQVHKSQRTSPMPVAALSATATTISTSSAKIISAAAISFRVQFITVRPVEYRGVVPCTAIYRQLQTSPVFPLSKRARILPKRAVNFSPAFARRYSAKTRDFICITRLGCRNGVAIATHPVTAKCRCSCSARSSTAIRANRSCAPSWKAAPLNGGSSFRNTTAWARRLTTRGEG